jgi:hypothetical protein
MQYSREDADDRQATHRQIRQPPPIGEIAYGAIPFSRSDDTTPTLRDMIASRERAPGSASIRDEFCSAVWHARNCVFVHGCC